MQATPNATNVGLPTGIDVIEDDPSIKIFPNPTAELLWIELDDAYGKFNFNKAEISLKDVLGRTAVAPIAINDKKVSIDMHDMAKGNYFLSITNGGQKIIKRIVRM